MGHREGETSKGKEIGHNGSTNEIWMVNDMMRSMQLGISATLSDLTKNCYLCMWPFLKLRDHSVLTCSVQKVN